MPHGEMLQHWAQHSVCTMMLLYWIPLAQCVPFNEAHLERHIKNIYIVMLKLTSL